MRLAAIAVGVVALLTSTTSAAAVVPGIDGPTSVGLYCTDRAPTPRITNILDAKWSPDGRTLAVAWFGRVPSTRTVSGYEESEITDLLDVRTGAVRPLGVGDQMLWSASGSLLSYWGPEADELRVVKKDGSVLARLAPTIPELVWQGERLIFVEKDEIREWAEGAVRTVARFSEDMRPQYPRDDLYWSADAERFTITRYSQDGETLRFLGLTRTAETVALDTGDARLIAWSPIGSRLLLRFADRFEIRDLASGGTVTSVPSFAGAIPEWSADGRLLLGRVSPTIPAGDVLDGYRVATGIGAGEPAALPNAMGMRSFSPDGRFFAGVVRTGLHETELRLYRCIDIAPRTPTIDPEDAALRLKALAATRAARPTAGEITQYFQGRHTGIDLTSPLGWPIFSDGDGTVTSVEWVNVGGLGVCVEHSPGYESCYYHTSVPLVAEGQHVVRGEPVALIGMTGLVTGPHTHWEVTLFGRTIDPLSR